ncbi:integrase [Streptomyces chryseus]|uniref:integrase n=1 Tax=Streptomyces chryseus TaxID=68186 RepID=UPI00110F7D6B|nr:integrase [Streptomyces chryseus]GGW95566.1 hypothetical protein GCM10010353_08400 [Streptomyces chryseus]
MATPGAARGPQALTRAEILALPAAIDLDTANRALAIGRSTGYALAKRDQYPCRVLRLGNAYRVITTDLLRILGIESPDEQAVPTPALAAVPAKSQAA